jgi:hypothetical protein
MSVTPLSDQSSAPLRAHQVAVIAAEQTRQTAIATATTNPAGALAVKNADIAFYRSLVTSGRANGIDVGGFLQALELLGTGGN